MSVMIIIVSKTMTKNVATRMIVKGFTGQLKHWWDNFIPDNLKPAIIDAQETITRENATTTRQIGIDKLMSTIVLYFLGSITDSEKTSQVTLLNLRCPTLD